MFNTFSKEKLVCSLYIHIPFCVSKCPYCDFYSITEWKELVYSYLDGLSEEWKIYENNGNYQISSLYIGGGTPSVLSTDEWNYFYKKLLCNLPLLDEYEWTIECNPDSFTEEKAEVWAEIGVNRLTFGVQSLNPTELTIIKRPHTNTEILYALESKVIKKFNSIGVDIIYGLPAQNSSSFSETLDNLLSRSIVKHLSAYELTISENSYFGKHSISLPLPDEEEMEKIYNILLAKTSLYNFKRYEVSNFSKVGFECKHNIGYWNHYPYIGLGASAHSYLHPFRYKNFSDIKKYISFVKKGELAVEEIDKLDNVKLAREMIFLGLRQIRGINEEVFKEKTGVSFIEWVDKEKVNKFIKNGLLIYSPPHWKPTEKGIMLADYMARELF